MTTGPLTERPRTSVSLRNEALTQGVGWASVAPGVPPPVRPGGLPRSLGVGNAPRHRLATLVGAAVTGVVPATDLCAAVTPTRRRERWN
jgi:hypothetical protein